MFVRFTKSLVSPIEISFYSFILVSVNQLPFSSYPVLTWPAKCSKSVKPWQIFIWFCFDTCVEMSVKLPAVCEDLVLYIYLHYGLPNCLKDSIIAEPNKSHRQQLFIQGDHLQLIFGDDIAEGIKDMPETSKVGQILTKKAITFLSVGRSTQNLWHSPSFSSQLQPFLYQGWDTTTKTQDINKLYKLPIPAKTLNDWIDLIDAYYSVQKLTSKNTYVLNFRVRNFYY